MKATLTTLLLAIFAGTAFGQTEAQWRKDYQEKIVHHYKYEYRKFQGHMLTIHGEGHLYKWDGKYNERSDREAWELLKDFKAGAIVDVLMTENATRFVTPLSFQSLTHRPVPLDMWQLLHEMDIAHVSLGHAAGLLIIAPATANTLAKLAHGMADNLLTSTALDTRAPILVAPAPWPTHPGFDLIGDGATLSDNVVRLEGDAGRQALERARVASGVPAMAMSMLIGTLSGCSSRLASVTLCLIWSISTRP